MENWITYGMIGLGLIVTFVAGHGFGSYWLYFGKSGRCIYHAGLGGGCRGPCGASLRGERARLLALREDIDQKIALCPEEGSPNREFASQIEAAKKCLALKNPAYAKLDEVFWSLHRPSTTACLEGLRASGPEENSPNRANHAHQ
jgi:hypothetical protein